MMTVTVLSLTMCAAFPSPKLPLIITLASVLVFFPHLCQTKNTLHEHLQGGRICFLVPVSEGPAFPRREGMADRLIHSTSVPGQGAPSLLSLFYFLAPVHGMVPLKA